MLRIAAETFALTPSADASAHSETQAPLERVVSPLQTTLFLLDHPDARVCLITSHWLGVHYYRFSNILRKRVSGALGLPFEQVLVFGSHNETCTALTRWHVKGLVQTDLFIEERELTADGKAFLEKATDIAAALRDRLQPCRVFYGVGQEDRITHNCKGRRADGTAYMIREEDRRKLGGDYQGEIDPDAPVIGFYGEDGKPIAFLTQFAGHPVTAYNPEKPIAFGEYPQLACDALSAANGGVPVGFLQGCAADLFSKGHDYGKPLDESIAGAEYHGRCLGETFVQTARKLKPSAAGERLDLQWEPVSLPFSGVPPADRLRADLAEIQRFLQCCQENNKEQTRDCVGLNFPLAMTPRYRAALVEPVRQWTEWALRFHTENRLQEAPTGITTPVAVLRVGDVGIAGMQCEPFMNIGKQIKRDAPLPLAIPCGYMNDTTLVNIPDSGNNGDREFMSATYRYTTTMLPYRQPAGDVLAETAVRLMKNSRQPAL